MKILSWNIWKGKHFEEVVKELKNQNADVLCLQEIKNDTKNLAEEIARALGYQFEYCQTFTTDRHTPVFSIGNAILSKSKIENTECVLLSDLSGYKKDSTTEPRGAIKANIGKYTVICTHLGFTRGHLATEIQRKQLDRLLNILSRDNCILAGDFNSFPGYEIVSSVEKIMTNTDISGTPTVLEEKDGGIIERKIDYIFVSKDVRFTNFKITPTSASDHKILTIDL